MSCVLVCATSFTKNKASGDNGTPADLFQILKDDTVKVLHSLCQHIWKIQQGPQDWKRSVFIPIPKKGNAKEQDQRLRIDSVDSRGYSWRVVSVT